MYSKEPMIHSNLINASANHFTSVSNFLHKFRITQNVVDEHSWFLGRTKYQLKNIMPWTGIIDFLSFMWCLKNDTNTEEIYHIYKIVFLNDSWPTLILFSIKNKQVPDVLKSQFFCTFTIHMHFSKYDNEKKQNHVFIMLYDVLQIHIVQSWSRKIRIKIFLIA